MSILTTTIPSQVSNNSLFVLNPNATGTYFEADPRFTGYKNWLSSDWMLGQLGIDPLSMHKRLGDGYYEQKLIRDQVAQLTGRRFLDGYSSDDAQYKALMQAGLTFAGEFGSRPGIALTAEQMARVTSDIVWLVERDVTLPDGTTVKALVPQVYVAVRKGDLSNTGALLAANQIQFNLTGDLTNSGSIAGRDIVSLNALSIHNLKGASISGAQVGLTALNDITNIGGTLKATDALVLNAGRNITMASTTQSQSGSGPYSWSQTGIDRVAGLCVTNPNGLGVLALNAGNNITLNAVSISNAGSNGVTQIKAGNTINLGTVGTGKSQNFEWDANNYTRTANTREIGTTISSANHIVLDAGTDINAKAANVYSSNGQVALVAGNNVNLQAGTNTDSSEDARKWKSSGLLSSTTTTTKDEATSTTAVGTSLSGDSIVIKASNDITTRAASVVATNGVVLSAGNNIDIGTAQNTSHEFHSKDSKTSGIFSDGGTGVSIGTKKQASTVTVDTVTNTGSVIGSLDGAVSMVAGKDVTITGSDVLSQTGTLISGQNVTVQNATDTQTTVQTNKTSSSGLHVYLKGGAADVANSLIGSAQGAMNADDPRLKALYVAQGAQTLMSNGFAGAKALGNAADNVQGIKKTADAMGNSAAPASDQGASGGISLRVGIGASSSNSTSTSTRATGVGSNISSQGDVIITARGDHEGNGGDLTVQGSTLSGHNVTLDANRDLILQSSQETSKDVAKNSAKSGEIGFTMGSEAGYGIYVSASGAKGSGEGNATTHQETQIAAANVLTTNSGRDTTLTGAQARGDTIIATIGRDLTITSQQDTDTYKRKDTSAGIDAAFGTGGGSVSGNANQSKIKSDYKSVNEQSGFEAGAGGYNITVGNHTQLNGGAIVSRADRSKNSHSTQTLSATTLDNQASYKANSVGFSASGGTSGGSFSPNLAPPAEDSAKSTTTSAISQGTVDIRGGDSSALANLDRDQVALQMKGLEKIFDEQKVNESIAMGQLAGQVGMTAVGDLGNWLQKQAKEDFAKAEEKGDIAGMQQAKDAYESWSNGGTAKTILHGLVGAGIAALGGGNALSGVLGAAGSEAIKPAMATFLDKLGVDSKSALYQSLMNVGSALVGAAVGQGAGAATALAGDKFNRQLHPDERQWIRDHADEFAKQLCNCEKPDAGQIKYAEDRLIAYAFVSVDQVAANMAGEHRVNDEGKNVLSPYVDREASIFFSKNPANFAWGQGFVRDEHYEDPNYNLYLITKKPEDFRSIVNALSNTRAASLEEQRAANIAAFYVYGDAVVRNDSRPFGYLAGAFAAPFVVAGATSSAAIAGYSAVLNGGVNAWRATGAFLSAHKWIGYGFDSVKTGTKLFPLTSVVDAGIEHQVHGTPFFDAYLDQYTVGNFVQNSAFGFLGGAAQYRMLKWAGLGDPRFAVDLAGASGTVIKKNVDALEFFGGQLFNQAIDSRNFAPVNVKSQPVIVAPPTRPTKVQPQPPKTDKDGVEE